MILLGLVLSALVAPESKGVAYRDLSVDVEGDLLDARLVQVTGDRRPELLLVVRSAETRKREIRIYTYESAPGAPEVLGAKPWRVVPVLADVAAFTVADVRDDPGRELLFLTRGGVFAMSPADTRLRGNIRRLIETDLVYEVPDPSELPFWRYVVPGRRDALVVPGESTFALWGPSSGRDGGYVELAEFSDSVDAGSRDERRNVVIEQSTSLTVAGSRASVSRTDSDASRVLVEGPEEERLILLSFDRRYAAPGLADLDGDGAIDLAVISGTQLHVHLSRGGRIPQQPTRIEKLPDYLDPPAKSDGAVTVELVDFDGDGDADLYVRERVESEGSGVVSGTFNLMFLRNDGERLLPQRPDQLLRFEAMELRAEIADVDGDGSKDLVVRKFEVPSVVDVVTSLDFTHTTLLFLGTGDRSGRVFDRRPVLKDARVFDEDSVGGAIAQRRLTWDCSGDGISDLVEIDVQGRVGIRLLERDSGFFSGETWSLDDDPWKRFEGRGSIGSLTVDDFNEDGLGDVLSRRSDGVLLLFSQRPGGRR